MYDLIKKYEGLSLESYKCPMGYWTIGYGNRWMKDGSAVVSGLKITKEYADELLEHFIKTEILPTFKTLGLNHLTQNQKEAVISLIYNIGLSTFLKSKLYTAIKNNNYAEICKEWDFGFINNLKGIFKRRTEELYLFISEI